MSRGSLLLLSWGLLILASSCVHPSEPEAKPNLVFILVDDLGYGDLGCYGNPVNQTPNIDRLAHEGLRFTDFHSNGPMCSPTRAAFLTGLYQYRFGPRFEKALDGIEHYHEGLPLEACTISEVLKTEGYATGIFGKWHLGYHPPYLPASQGFDEFIGLGAGDGDHHTHIDRSGREDWWRLDEAAMEEGYSTDLITAHSIDFTERHPGSALLPLCLISSNSFPLAGAGRSSPSESGAQVLTMDLFPTFAELAGVNLPEKLEPDGYSLVPLLLDGIDPPSRVACWKNGEHRAIRRGRWKFCLIGENGQELFDLESDIGETVNLASEHPQFG